MYLINNDQSFKIIEFVNLTKHKPGSLLMLLNSKRYLVVRVRVVNPQKVVFSKDNVNQYLKKLK
jgi:hypothetical protein